MTDTDSTHLINSSLKGNSSNIIGTTYLLSELESMEAIADFLNTFNFQTPAFTVGLAYLTVLIPIAIAIFGKEEIETLDRNVHLHYIIRAKYFLLIFAAIFVPPSIWFIFPAWFRILEITIWAIGIYFMNTILVRSYKWMRTDKYDSRYKYLEALRKGKDIQESWHSLWDQKNIKPATEQIFLKLFFTKLDGSISRGSSNDTASDAINLLKDFENLLENRFPINLMIGDDIFPRLLSWHHIAWTKEKSVFKNSFDLNTYELTFTLEQLIRKIELNTLKARLFIHLLRHLAQFAEKHKKEFEVVQNLLSIFFYEFSANAAEIPTRKNLWHHFPPRWRITEANLRSQDNRVYANAWWQIYANWALPRVFDAKIEYEEFLDEASNALFPGVDPIIWAKLQIFGFLPGESGERITYAIRHPWTFGRWSVLPAFIAGEDISHIDTENFVRKEKAFNLARILFKNLYTPEKLRNYTTMLETIGVAENSPEDYKRKFLFKMFSDMLNYLKNGNTN